MSVYLPGDSVIWHGKRTFDKNRRPCPAKFLHDYNAPGAWRGEVVIELLDATIFATGTILAVPLDEVSPELTERIAR